MNHSPQFQTIGSETAYGGAVWTSSAELMREFTYLKLNNCFQNRKKSRKCTTTPKLFPKPIYQYTL